MRPRASVCTLLGLLAAAVAGCTTAPACDPAFVGDRHAPPEISLFQLDPRGGGAMLLVAGDSVPLEQPPQGGFVLFVGARLRNMAACGVTQTALLRDAATGAELPGRASARSDLTLRADGWGWPDEEHPTLSIPNVAACPNFLARGIDAVSATLEVSAVDGDGRTATRSIAITPACAPGSSRDFCRCACGPDYLPGRCPTWMGASDAAAGDGE